MLLETVSDDAAAKQIEIRIQFDTPEEVIFVDADPLRSSRYLEPAEQRGEVNTRGGSVTILVSRGWPRYVDCGGQWPSIEPEFLPHVFEMFRQADASSSRPHGGMGIGLALVRQLIGLHGGTVAVESVMGRGAKVHDRALATRETEKSLGFAPQMEAGALSQMRILVVDDSSDTVDMLRRLFEMDGALVTTARGGAEALEIAVEKILMLCSPTSQCREWTALESFGDCAR